MIRKTIKPLNRYTKSPAGVFTYWTTGYVETFWLLWFISIYSREVVTKISKY